MTTVQELIEIQNKLFGRIARSVENLNKLGPSKLDRYQVETRLHMLDDYKSKFYDNDVALTSILIKASVTLRTELEELHYFTEDLPAQCVKQYAKAKGSMAYILASLHPATTKSTASTSTTSDQTQSASSGSRSRRLPRIELPLFAGDFTGWKHFCDLFTSIIILSNEVTQVEKLHYLNTCLKGEPAQLIKNIPVTGENFERAWATLVARYENKRRLADANFTTLFGLPRVTRKSADDLKQLYTSTEESLGALEALGVRSWEYLVVHTTIKKFDQDTLEEWEKRIGERTEPQSYVELKSFLVGRIGTLEAIEQHHPLPAKGKVSHSQEKPKASVKSHTSQTRESACINCKKNHSVSSCPEIRKKSIDERKEFISTHKLCYNCMGSHQIKECPSPRRCLVCNGRHHTLIHRTTSSDYSGQQSSNAPDSNSAVPSSGSDPSLASHSALPTTLRRSPVLLATVQIIVGNPTTGRSVIARALLDQGSETSFISESLTQQLRLKRHHATIPVTGVGAQQSGLTRGTTSITMRSRVSTFLLQEEAYVLPRLTGFLPSRQILAENWPHLCSIALADPMFDRPSQIDLILGIAVCNRVIEGLSGRRNGPLNTPTAHETKCGWVLSGNVMASDSISSFHALPQDFQGSLDHELRDLVQRFWQQEEICTTTVLSPEDERCEQHFINTVSRDATGRYTVRLPVKDPPLTLGNSRTPARYMLERMERRFAKDPKFKEAYSDFLQEYHRLSHMRRALETPQVSSSAFYLPHHGITKETSSTTRLRVVFNASQKTDLGRSLNENLHVGPKIQTDLAEVLTRWRQHRIAFTCDVEKMYRQINVHEDDQDLQRILWRESSEIPVQEYQLRTVTYGLACAPFLAIRVLQQLVNDEGRPFPLASRAIRENTYVDDVLSGASDINQGRECIQLLIKLLKAGGFELQKWTASHPEVLDVIASDKLETAALLSLDQSQIFRALGLAWKPASDVFTFTPQPRSTSPHVTKRQVLSQIAQLFDPLGWLAPVVITAKIFLQELWTLGLGWDAELPESLTLRWNDFVKQLPSISGISLPRWIGLHPTPSSVEIHGFSDASTAALGAVLYIRVSSGFELQVSLLAAKTKVAPLKTVTIPRLELCAALLLVRQARHLCQVLQLNHEAIHLWTDPTIALAWIKRHPSRLKDFVRNRVSEIQEFTRAQWHHVVGSENPADLASRGVPSPQLQGSQLWWSGPAWLSQPSTSWPSTIPTTDPIVDDEERKETLVHHTGIHPPVVWELSTRYSTLAKLLRITSVCKRVVQRFQALIGKAPPPTGAITTYELDDAQEFWVRVTQRAYFNGAIDQITSGTNLPHHHPLARYSPFIDRKGLLRVSGRLAHSHLTDDEKYPIILPQKSVITTLLIEHHHHDTLHGGTQLTLATLRQRYWIIGGRVPVRSIIRRCVICTRQRAVLSNQQMGQLPPSRVIQSRPFQNSGVDYAGPFTVKAFRGRTPRTYKRYILVFVCFAVSAVYLELVSDYSAAGFIAAYKRFTARKGICTTLTSDCGRNFIGADADLRRLLTAATKESDELAGKLAALSAPSGTSTHLPLRTSAGNGRQG